MYKKPELEDDMQIKRIPLSWVVTSKLSESLNYYDKGMKQLKTNKLIGVTVGDDQSGIRLSKLITYNRKVFGYQMKDCSIPEWASVLKHTINHIIEAEYEESD
jgi:hypothetical protein